MRRTQPSDLMLACELQRIHRCGVKLDGTKGASARHNQWHIRKVVDRFRWNDKKQKNERWYGFLDGAHKYESGADRKYSVIEFSNTFDAISIGVGFILTHMMEW